MSPQLFAICSTAGYAMISNVVCLVSFAAVLAIWIAVLVYSIRGGAQGGRRRKVLIRSLLMVLPLVLFWVISLLCMTMRSFIFRYLAVRTGRLYLRFYLLRVLARFVVCGVGRLLSCSCEP